MRIFVVALAPLVHFNSIRIDRLRWKCYNYQSTAAELLRMMPAAAGFANVHIAYVRCSLWLCVSVYPTIRSINHYVTYELRLLLGINRIGWNWKVVFHFYFSTSFARAHTIFCADFEWLLLLLLFTCLRSMLAMIFAFSFSGWSLSSLYGWIHIRPCANKFNAMQSAVTCFGLKMVSMQQRWHTFAYIFLGSHRTIFSHCPNFIRFPLRSHRPFSRWRWFIC